jgi:hypothetical protein
VQGFTLKVACPLYPLGLCKSDFFTPKKPALSLLTAPILHFSFAESNALLGDPGVFQGCRTHSYGLAREGGNLGADLCRSFPFQIGLIKVSVKRDKG